MSTRVSVEHTVQDLGIIFDSWLTMADHVVAMSLWLLPIASAPPCGTFPVSWWCQGSGPCLHFEQAWLLQLATYWHRQLPASLITVAPEYGCTSWRSSPWTHHTDTQATSLAPSTSACSVQAGNPGTLIIIRPGTSVSYRRLSARCWIRTADTQISGTILLRYTMLQQHLWRQIIRSSWSACLERPSCYPSQHQADNGHFLPSANISKLFGLLIHEVVAHSWHSDFTAPFINVRTYLDGISVV